MHGAANYLPDFLEYMGDQHGHMTVKHGILGHNRDMETTTMDVYRERVRENYKGGTFRFGFLDNISLVGTVAEESGGYFPDILDMLEESPFLRMVIVSIIICCSTWPYYLAFLISVDALGRHVQAV